MLTLILFAGISFEGKRAVTQVDLMKNERYYIIP